MASIRGSAESTAALDLIQKHAYVGDLQRAGWYGDGKKQFLMGKVYVGAFKVAIPLSEEDAEEALREYRNRQDIA